MAQKATVKLVLSGDTLILRGQPKGNAPPPERQLSLHGIVAPRFRVNDPEPFAYESREFIRTLCVGQVVAFKVDFVTNAGREYGSVMLNQINLAHEMVKEGWARVKEEKSDKEEAVEMKALRELEAKAREQNKGVWGTATPRAFYNNAPYDIGQFFNSYKAQPVPAIVEQVRDASTYRVQLLLPAAGENQKHVHVFITLMLSGVRAPLVRVGVEGVDDVIEPFGEEAKYFCETRLLQRQVLVVLQGVSNQSLVGTIKHPAGVITELLVANGYGRIVDWSLNMYAEPSKLRAIEKSAKDKKLRIWKDYVAKSLPTDVEAEFHGTVIKVVGADALVVESASSSKERKLKLSSIRPPKLTDPKEAGYFHEAKEFLRKRFIGKSVHVHVDYIKPAEGEYEARTCATIKYKDTNLAEALVSRGLVAVIRHKKDDDERAQFYDHLVIAETKATADKKGLFSGKDVIAPAVRDVSDSAARAKSMLSSYQRAGRISCVVDYVANAGRFKMWIPKENIKMTLVLSGVIVPRVARNEKEKSEPFGAEALALTTKRCLQRDVEIQVESVDRSGGFIGTLWVDKTTNWAVELLRQGFATIHEYSAESSAYTTQLFEAEQAAKKDKVHVWSLEQPTNVTAVVVDVDKDEYLDVVVTDVREAGAFSFQIVNHEAKELERIMSRLAAHHAKTDLTKSVSFRPRVNELCSAKFSQDGQWYRARVAKYEPNQQALVVYVDYGNTEVISVTHLRPLEAEFAQLKPQALNGTLAYTKVPGYSTDYGQDATSKLAQLVQDKQLVAHVVHRDASNVLHAVLYDPADSPSPEVSLNADMCRDGYARVTVGSTAKKGVKESLEKLQEEAKRHHVRPSLLSIIGLVWHVGVRRRCGRVIKIYRNVDRFFWPNPLHERVDNVVDGCKHAKHLTCNDTHTIVTPQTLHQGRHFGLYDAVVDHFGPLSNIAPAVHFAHLIVLCYGIHLVHLDARDSVRHGEHEVVLFCLSKSNHFGWEHFRDATHLGAHHQQPTARCLDNGGTKGFRERCVEKDLSLHEHVAHLVVLDGSKETHAVLQQVLFPHLFQIQSFGSVATNDEAHTRKHAADAWNDRYEEIDAFSVHKPTHDHNGDVMWVGCCGVGRELVTHDSIGNDRHVGWIERCTQYRVLLARVRHTNDVVHVRQRELEELVGNDTACVCEPKQRMVRKARVHPHGTRVKDGLVCQRREGLVTVDNVQAFAYKDIAHDGERGEERGQ
jgi:staphylococcal nuclease domain-containing protein 1